jgi:hypothetical protein
MQKYPSNLSQDERRLARRWTLGSIGIYGSMIAGMLLYTTFIRSPNVDVATASVSKFSGAQAPRHQPADRPGMALPPR